MLSCLAMADLLTQSLAGEASDFLCLPRWRRNSQAPRAGARSRQRLW